MSGPTADAQLRGFIAKFTPEHQRIIRGTRKALRARIPTATELVYDNYNFFVIGYSPSGRPSDSIVSIAAGANGIGVCFIRGKGLPDPEGLLQGSGNQTRFLRVPGPEVLHRPAVKALLAAAIAKSRAPLPKKGRGALVIRSVSAKQRPRRKKG